MAERMTIDELKRFVEFLKQSDKSKFAGVNRKQFKR